MHEGLTPPAAYPLPLSLSSFPFAALTQEIATGMRLLGPESVDEIRLEVLELLDGLVGKQL